MPQVYLSTFGGVGAQFFDNNGNPLSGGKIFSYAAGTTTALTTYTSQTASAAHTNPIILDAAGRVPGGEIWVIAGLEYKFVLKTSANVLIATYDDVGSIAAGTGIVQDFSGDGVTRTFTLSFVPTAINSTLVHIDGVYQFKNTYALYDNALVFSEAPPATTSIEVLYF